MRLRPLLLVPSPVAVVAALPGHRRMPSSRPASRSPCRGPGSQPTAVRFAADGRVFVAEQRGRDQGLRHRSTTRRRRSTPTSRRTSHDFWDRGLLGMALDPEFTTGRPVRLRRSTPTTRDRRHAPRAGATPARRRRAPTGDGCVVSGRLSKLHADGIETPLIRRLVPAVPEPLGRRPRLRRRTARSTSPPATAPASRSPTTARTARPVNPCGDPPGAGGADAADRRGRRAAQPGPRARPATRRASTARSCASTPTPARPLPDNPAPAARTPTTRRIVAYGLRNPFRFAVPPGHDDLYVGDVGWNAGRRSTASPTPTAAVRNFGWPCYEGAGRQAGYDALNLNICETSTPQAPARTPRRCTRTTTPPRSSPARLPGGHLVDLRPRVLRRRDVPGRATTARCSSPTTRATASG